MLALHRFLFGAGGRPAIWPYEIEYSALFNGSAYLTYTPTTNGDRQRFGFDFWLKRTSLDDTPLFSVGDDSAKFFAIELRRDDATVAPVLAVYDRNSSVYGCQWYSDPLFVDETGHYHIKIQIDTTLADVNERVRLWVNGVEVGGRYDTPEEAPSQGFSFQWGAASLPHFIGALDPAWQNLKMDGYLSNVHIYEGDNSTEFAGEFSSLVPGLWVPKEASYNYGPNGAHLDFSDAANLGKDASGNGNDWVVHSESFYFMESLSQVTDTPTKNLATWNPHSGPWSTSYKMNLSTGNRYFSGASSAYGSGYSTVSFDPFSIEFFMKIFIRTAGSLGLGIAENNDPNVRDDPGSYLYLPNGSIRHDGSTVAYGETYTDNDEITIRVENGELRFEKNGVDQGVAASGLSGEYWIVAQDSSSNHPAQCIIMDTNLGSSALPEPEVLDSSTGVFLNLRTGNGTSDTIDVGFAPDLVISKCSSTTGDWLWYDSLRGATKELNSNNDEAENTNTNGLTSFTGSGFSIGSAAAINASGQKFVDLCLKKNPKYGFDVVTYTGDGVAGRQVAHNCGGVPEMWIVKRRDNPDYWYVGHKALGGTQCVNLNSNGGFTAKTVWNDQYPTSTHITLGPNSGVNAAGDEYIMYVFRSVPGFSKVFSYDGNNDVDGPFTSLGFTPLVIPFLKADASVHWRWMDMVRETSNPIDTALSSSLANAEISGDMITALSNGFKCINDTAEINDPTTYIGIAFAAQPFKYSNAF